MSGLRRLSDTALAGGVAGAIGGQVPVYNSGTGRFAPGTGKYDGRTSLYNANPAGLRRARAGLAAAQAGTDNCRIAVLGTSLSTISGGLTAFSQTWPRQLTTLLGTRGYTAGGTGLVPAGGDVYATDTRWVMTGTWASRSPNARSFFAYTTTTGASTTFTSDVAGTVLDLYVLNNNGGFSYAIDGGSTVTPAAGTGATTVRKISVTGLANTTHSVTVTCTSGTMFVVGARVAPAAGVVEVTNLGYSGNTTADVVGTSAGGSSTYCPLADVTAYAPHLTFVELLTNDGNPVPAQSITNMQTIITTLTGAGSDVVLVAEPPRGDAAIALPPLIQTAVYSLADTYSLPVVDLYDRFGTFASMSALGLGYTDNLHMKAPGHAEVSRAALSALGV